MALKIELKPNERMIIGDCVVTNVDQRARLLIDAKVPILCKKDIMSVSAPTARLSASLRPQRTIEGTAKHPKDHHAFYLGLVRGLARPAPSARISIGGAINNRSSTGDLYKGLKETRKLFDYEKGLLDHAKQISS